MSSRVAVRAASLAAALALVGAAVGTSPALAYSGTWSQYHLHLPHDGNDGAEQPFTAIQSNWSTPLPARSSGTSPNVYGEPLVAGGMVYVATIDNRVFGLDEGTGAIKWTADLGTPVDASTLPCGDISPTVGELSTPVLDTVTNTLYAVAFVATGGDHHELFAIDASTGAINWQVSADPASLPSPTTPDVEQQRGALALGNGYVYIPYGGLAGDCGAYHGFLVAISTSSHGQVGEWQSSGTVDPSDTQSGIWAASGPAIDSSGSVYVTTGNGYSNSGYDYSETVAKLSPTLQLQASWAPGDWQNLDNGDTDVGSLGPLLVSNGLVFQIGKAGVGYLIRETSPGVIGPAAYQRQVTGVTSDACFGGDAFAGQRIFVGCRDGLYALNLNASAPSFSIAWHALPNQGLVKPPIVAANAVWAIANGNLYALDPVSGNVDATLNLPGDANSFATPAAADNMIFVPGTTSVDAYTLVTAPSNTTRLGGSLPAGADATTAEAPGRVDVVSLGWDHAVWHSWSTDGGKTYQWESLGGYGISSPAIVGWSNHLEVFVTGSNHAVWHKWWDGTSWSGWYSLGGYWPGAPDASSWGSGRMDVVARGTNNDLYHAWYDGSWHNWESLATGVSTDPTVASSHVNQIEVFWRGFDQAIWHRYWNGSSWSGFSSLGGVVVGSPVAASPGNGGIDVFVRGTNNAVWQSYWDPVSAVWHPWASDGGNWTADPGAAPYGSGYLVFERGIDYALWQTQV